jgi:hypothetical protein
MTRQNKRLTISTLTCSMKEKRPHNSTYPKGGVSCSKDSIMVNQTLVFQIKFCGKSPALRVAAKRYWQCGQKNFSTVQLTEINITFNW